MIGRTSVASRFNIDKFSEVLGLRGMEKVVGKRDNFVMDAHFYFEVVQRCKYWGDMFSFGFELLREQGSFCISWRRDICFCGKFR